MIRMTLAALAFVLAPLAVWADEVTDTLNSALSAYEEGDIQYALEELEYARQLLNELKKDALAKFLPEALEGWTRELNAQMNAGMAGFGGGIGTEAKYSNGADSFTITLMTGNPMVGALGGMIANAAAIGARIERVGRQKFMNQNNELTALIDGRVLVQARGANPDQILETLALIDYRALGRFGL
ncbi:MAG: hypothetical protein ACC646_11625 [Paracoccaceae bacterium]